MRKCIVFSLREKQNPNRFHWLTKSSPSTQQEKPSAPSSSDNQVPEPASCTGTCWRGQGRTSEGACRVDPVGPLVSGPSGPVSSALKDGWWVSTLQQRPFYTSINELLNMMFRDIFPLKNNPQVREKESAPSWPPFKISLPRRWLRSFVL